MIDIGGECKCNKRAKPTQPFKPKAIFEAKRIFKIGWCSDCHKISILRYDSNKDKYNIFRLIYPNIMGDGGDLIHCKACFESLKSEIYQKQGKILVVKG